METKETNKDTATDSHIVIDLEKLTLSDLLKVVMAIRPIALVSLIGTSLTVFLGYSFFIYELGVKEQNKKIALELRSPFKIHIQPQALGANSLKSNQIALEKVYLLEDKTAPINPSNIDSITLEIRRVRGDSLTEGIGQIHAERTQLKSSSSYLFNPFKWLGSLNMIEKAYAQSSFDWNGHEHNYQFREEYINRDTIRRYYDNGSILEYKVDSNGKSIPTTFVWINVV